MNGRRHTLALGALWGATLTAVAWLLIQLTPTAADRPGLPSIGDVLPLDSLRSVFQLESAPTPDMWLLVVTSNCPFCLALDTELSVLRAGAACAGAKLLPLVVEFVAPTDSITRVLARHQLEPAGASGPDGLIALGVYSVPAVLMIDESGSVKGVSNPGLPGSWPPVVEC